MAIGYLDSQKLTNIGDAIRSASGSETTYTVDQMPNAIRSIAPEQPRVFKDVNFFDYDGTILYQYDLAEAKALTELPPLPASPKAGYTADSWTETLSFIQNLTGPCDVGVNYTTTNDFSEIKLSIPEDNYQVCTKGSSYDTQEGSGIFTWIEWGDGTERDRLSSTRRVIHTYAQKGDYYVKLYASYNYYCLPDPYMTTSSSDAKNSGAMIMPFPCTIPAPASWTKNNIITEVWVGKGLNLNSITLYLRECYSLKSIMWPQNATMSSRYISLYLLHSPFKHLTIPSTYSLLSSDGGEGGPETIVLPSSKSVGNTNFWFRNTRRYISYNVTSGSFSFQANPNLELLVAKPTSLSYSFEGLGAKNIYVNTAGSYTNIFKDCVNLESMDVSYLTGTSLRQGMFQGCVSLKRVILPTTLTSIERSVFQGSGIENITIPSSVTSLGSLCFYRSMIKNITLPNNTITFGESCFENCVNLSEIHFWIPNFGNYCFKDCYNLTAIYIHGTSLPSSWQGSSIFSGDANVTIYVPNSILADYQTAFSTYASLMQGWDPPTN